MPQEIKISLEPLQPGLHRRLNTPKVFVVPFFPEAPSSNHQHLHEHRIGPHHPASMHNIHPVPIQGPNHPQQVPALPTEGASEEQMLDSLLRVIGTEEAAVVIMLKSHSPPPEHGPGVEPVSKQ